MLSHNYLYQMVMSTPFHRQAPCSFREFQESVLLLPFISLKKKLLHPCVPKHHGGNFGFILSIRSCFQAEAAFSDEDENGQ